MVVKRLFDPLKIALLSFSISLLAGAFALQATATSTAETKSRIANVQYVTSQNNQKLRDSFCGLLLPLTKVQSKTQAGQDYVNAAKNSVKTLGC